ncbi:MAG: two-component sensor histidine kinase [Oscillospiraceae bacterium]|nr:two-component sensor histidine kinase [Oscillospiraceae bacterium]
MRKAINNTLRIFVISAVVVTTILMFVAYCAQFSVKKHDEIKSRMDTLVSRIDSYSGEEAVEILRNTYDGADVRITLVSPDGTVIYDNEADAGEMGNHSERPEIQEALSNGSGEGSRESETIGERIYYYAVRLSDGSVLRMAQSTDVIMGMGMSILPIALIILIAVIGVAFPVSKSLTKRIMEPVNNVDINNIGSAEIYDELKPFFTRIAHENEEKAQTEKIRREFTANVSHELKTPLTTISGYAQMINNGMAKQEDISEFGRKIEKEADRLLNLIDDIINLSSLDERTGISNPENVDLAMITEEAICVVEKAAKERGIQIFYSREPACIRGNATLISELVYNLLDNAVKYNKDNGKIIVFVGETVDGVELSVRDTGIGIPHEDKERIFERFYRVDKSHSKKVGGTGLGLSIVKHVCACHDAKIRVKSIVGKGTTIYVTFPANINNE